MNATQTKGTKDAVKPPVAAAEKPAKAPKQKAAPKGKAAAKEAAKPAVIKLSIPITATAKEIDKAIVSIQTRGKKLDIDMHSAACASLHHVTLHNDPTLLNRLVLAMPQAARRNALVVWALKFGMVALNDDAKTKADRPLVFAKENKANIEQAQQQPFYSFKNIREGGSEWLYSDFIGNVIKTLERHAAGMDVNEGAKAKAALEALKGVNQALAVPATAPALPVGVEQERRAVVH